jgi:adenosine kinase
MKIVILNLSGAEVVKKYATDIADLLPFCQVVLGKQKEFMTLATSQGLKFETITDVATALSKLYDSELTIVITQGTKDTIVCSNGVITEYPVDVVPKDKIVDMIGSGGKILIIHKLTL